MSVLSSIVGGVCASAVGTLTMDTLLYRRYRDGGGQFSFLAWESSEGVDSWDRAPAPARSLPSDASIILDSIAGSDS